MYFRWWQLKLPFFVEPSATISTWKWVVASKFVQAVFSLSCCIQTIRYDIFCGSKQIRGNLLSELFNPLKVCVLRLQSCRKHYMVGRLVVLFLLELICSTSCLSTACNIFDFIPKLKFGSLFLSDRLVCKQYNRFWKTANNCLKLIS